MRGDHGYFEERGLERPYDLRLLVRLAPFARPYGRWLVAAVSLVVLITLLDLALPWITKMAIDRYIVPSASTQESPGVPASGDAGPSERLLIVDPTSPEAVAARRDCPDCFQDHDGRPRLRYERIGDLKPALLTVLRRADLEGVARLTVLFLLLAVGALVFNFFQVMIMEYAGQMILHDLRTGLYEHIQRLPVEFFTRNSTGRLVTRVTNDTQNMHELFTSVVAFVFKDLFLLLGITALLFGLHWKLALAVFTVMPIVALATVYFARRAREAYRTLRIKIAEINSRFSETIGGIRVIQSFRYEAENYKNFKFLNHEHYLAGMLQIHVFALFMPVIEVLGVIVLAIVIFYGGSNVLAGSITLGGMVAFISYLRMFFRPIRDIAEKYNVMQNALSSAERIFQILNTEIPAAETGAAGPSAAHPAVAGRGPAPGGLEFQKVWFGYRPRTPVLKGISFRLDPGETVAVVGTTGAGKTSLIHLIPRFYDPQRGSIRLHGRRIDRMDLDDLRGRLALVMQDPFLFSATVRENLSGGGRPLSDRQLAPVIDAACCRELIERLPSGLDTRMAEGGSSVSSGERQLLSIARALARDPELILLDEATSYIDSQTEHKVQQALQNLMSGRSAILVAHRLSTARTADRILVLRNGEIVESGTHVDLMARNGFYARMTRLQN